MDCAVVTSNQPIEHTAISDARKKRTRDVIEIMSSEVNTTSDKHLLSIIQENKDESECCICLCNK
jgi:hypothetical protein